MSDDLRARLTALADEWEPGVWAIGNGHAAAALRALLATPAEPARESDGVGLREDEREAICQPLWETGCYGFTDDHPELFAAVERIIAARVAEAGARALEASHCAADELDEWDGDASSSLGGCSPGGVVRHAAHEAAGVEIDDCPACAKRTAADQ